MAIDLLIIGQGICGTWLSYYAEKAGLSYKVIDEQRPDRASYIASGIINPVTGRRIVKTWMIDEVMPFAAQAYTEFGTELGIEGIFLKPIIDQHASPQMKLAFEERVKEGTEYISLPENERDWLEYFDYPFGYGTIHPAYVVNSPELLVAWRKILKHKERLLEERFELNELNLDKEWLTYKGVEAHKIVFCDGIDSFENPWFERLPSTKNKGEVIWIECKGLPDTHIFKKGMNLVPWEKDIFWVGSTYEWEFTDPNPTAAFREKTLAHLNQWLKLPFKVLEHKASIRPATMERRPYVGFHPKDERIGILNGMGTKGFSLGPYFAQQLVEHLKNGRTIAPEADLKRFSRILSR